MQTADVLSSLAVYLVLVFPGIMLARFLFRGRDEAEILFAGSVLGTCLAVFFGYLSCMWGMGAFPYILALQYAVAVPLFVIALRRRRPPDEQRKSPLVLLWLLLPAVFVSRMIPLFFSELPKGWDPAFHCIIARKILIGRAIPRDWMPFDPSAMNYTLGSHVLIAFVSAFSHVPVHQVFKILFPVFATLSALGIYLLCITFTGSRATGILGIIAYAFLANWGSLDYYRWGGLPSLLGMLMFLGVLWAVFNLEGRKRVVTGGFFLAGIFLTHHLTAVAALWVFVAYVFLYWISFRRLNDIGGAFLQVTGVALVICSIEILPSLGKFHSISSTSTLEFFDEPAILLDKMLADLGIVFVILSVIGLFIWFKRAESDAQFFPLYWLSALFLAYVGLDYGYRFGAALVMNKSFTAFTPSRFLTDMAYPLSIVCAAGMNAMRKRFGRDGLFGLACAALALNAFPAIRSQCASDGRSPANPELLRWMARNIPENAILYVNDQWAPYITWRETFYTPLPASESRNSEYNKEKDRIATFDDARAFLARYGRDGYIAIDSRESPDPKIFKLVLRSPDWCLYEILR